MSDFDEFDEQEERQPLDPNIRKQLREAEKAKKELESLRAELDSERREVQFSKAGIPDTGVGALLRKAYDGPTDAESIRKAAEEYGIFQVQQEAPQSDPMNPELEAMRRAQGATVGTSGAMPDPSQLFAQRLAEASNPDEVMKIVMSQEAQQLGLYTSREAL